MSNSIDIVGERDKVLSFKRHILDDLRKYISFTPSPEIQGKVVDVNNELKSPNMNSNDPDNKGILKSRSPYLSSQAPVGSKGSENQEFSIDTYPQNTSNQYLSYPPSLQQSPASKMNKMIMSAPINIANNARPAPISRSNRSTSKTLPIIDTKIASVTSNRSDGDVATSNTKRKDLAIMKLAISERRTLLGRKGVSPILPRSKCHWDLVLDEMQWMAIDYRQELRWKISNAQAIAELCKTGIQERFQQRSQNESIRQVASDISGRVSAFWNSVRSDLGRSNEVTTPCGTPEIEKLDLNIVDVMSGYLQVFRNIDNECPEISCIDDKNNSHENARKRIDSLIYRDFGVLIHGASGTGKTRFAVSMISSFYKSYKDLLLIVPRQRTLRWISELESISELRVLYVRDSEILFQSNSPSVYICPLELLLSSDMRKKILPKFSCVFLDFRCPSSHMWNCTGKLSKYWRCRLLDLISPHLISQCNRCIIDSSFPSDDWKPYLRFCLPRSVVFSKPFESWLNCQTSEFTAYVVKCVSARLVVDERMELQIKEEILSMEMDSLQHLKYIQVIENLLHQSAFTGDNPWVLAQALTLLRRACFHEAFVSVGLGRQRALPAPQTQNTYYSSINPYQNMYGNNSQYINGVGLGFGVGTGSFYSGVQYFSSQPCIQPSAEGFSEVIMNDYDEEGIDGLRSRFFDSGILRHMRTCHFSSRHDDGNSNNYINSGLHGSSMMDSTSSVTFTIPAMVTCFAPGPLAAKLSSPPKFNMNGNFYDSIGSCKLQALCKLLTRYAGLHIVVTVFTDDEQLAVHHFLNRLGYDHIVAGILGNRFSDSMSLEGGSASLVWLKTQLAVSQFNKIPSANNAILVTTSRIFKDDDLIPYAADVVIILSDDWLTPVDIKRHYRLRLRKNGAPKDPVTIMRLVAKGTLEEIVVRKGSLLNLQGSGLNDVLSLSPQYVQMYSHLSHKILVRAPLLSFQNIKEEFKIESDNNSSESSTTKNLSIPRHGDLSHYNPSAQIWLREVEFGVEYAEFQFSRMGKYMPYSLIRKEANNKYLTNPIDPLIQAQSSVQNSGSQPLSSSIEAKKSAIVFDLMRNESGGEIVSNAVSDAILSTYLHSNKKFGIKGLNIFARLLGFMVRDYLNSKEDDLYHVTLSKPGRNSSPLLMNCKWKSVGLGGNRAEKLFYSMNQIPGDSLQPGHRDASMLSLQVYGGSLSRSCQFFRNLQSFSRRIGQNIDPLLYLNPLNNADLYELVLRPSYCQQSDHFSFPLSIKYYIKPTTTKTVKKVGSKPTRADVQSLARKRLLDSSLVVDARRKRIMLLSSSGTRPDEYNNVDCDSLSQLSSDSHQANVNQNSDMWFPREDDLLLAVQSAFDDPNFILTQIMLNKFPCRIGLNRTVEQARDRYDYLFRLGKRCFEDPEKIREAVYQLFRFSKEIVSYGDGQLSSTGSNSSSSSSPSSLNPDYTTFSNNTNLNMSMNMNGIYNTNNNNHNSNGNASGTMVGMTSNALMEGSAASPLTVSLGYNLNLGNTAIMNQYFSNNVSNSNASNNTMAISGLTMNNFNASSLLNSSSQSQSSSSTSTSTAPMTSSSLSSSSSISTTNTSSASTSGSNHSTALPSNFGVSTTLPSSSSTLPPLSSTANSSSNTSISHN